MIRKFRVLVLGYGRMGRAMHYLLESRNTLSFWDSSPPPEMKIIDLEQSASQADFVFFCIPVNPHREMALRLASLLPKQCVCLSIAKGLDENGRTAAQIFDEVLGNAHPYGLLYGPMIAEDLIASRAGFAQLGYSSHSVPEKVLRLFSHTPLYIRPSTDTTGISWAVILKNIYALLFGIADELNLGDNVRGFLAVQALEELDAIVQSMGGKARTPWHLAGLGDLVTTATSAGSHHHDLGCKLARGETLNLLGEGVHTLEMVDKYRLFDSSVYPLYRLIHDFVHDPRDIKERLRTYLESEFNPDLC